MVSSNYAIELLKKSLNLYTPSRSEGQLANLLKEKCVNELGFEQANIDSVGNIIATKGGGYPRILLCGHMDTVPNKVPVRIESCQTKSIFTFSACKLKCNWIVVFKKVIPCALHIIRVFQHIWKAFDLIKPDKFFLSHKSCKNKRAERLQLSSLEKTSLSNDNFFVY